MNRSVATVVAVSGFAVVLGFFSVVEAEKGGGADKDLDVCITMDPGGLTGDGAGDYCGSDRGVASFVGRRRTITLDIVANSGRTLSLTLGARLPDIAGDPDPNDDGGVVNQSAPGDWSNHALPVIPAGGVIGDLQVAVLANVLRMGEPGEEPNPNFRNARLRFTDANGQDWQLLWGPLPQPGNFQRTNPAAPAVRIERNTDGAGNLTSEWDVTTTADTDTTAGRSGAATAFLWRSPRGNVPYEYWGAFDISFSYTAVEEP